MKPSHWPSSNPAWGLEARHLQLPERVTRSPHYITLLQAIQTVKGQANRALLARRRENIGKTADEAAAMMAVSNTKAGVWRRVEAATQAVEAFQPAKVPVDARLMTWQTSAKYRTQLPSHFIRLVRQLVAELREAKAAMTDVLLEKKRLVANAAVQKVTRSFNQAIDDLSELLVAKAFRLDGSGLTDSQRVTLKSLAATEPRYDSAYCALTGVAIQVWNTSEGTLRYHCPDGDCVYHTREMHDCLRRVIAKIHSVAHYPGLVVQALEELRKLDPLIVDGHWVLENTLTSRVRTVAVQEVSTPAALLAEVCTTFKQRLLLGLPSRLKHHFTLDASLLTEHMGYAWMTYQDVFRTATTLAQCLRSILGRGSTVAVACVPGTNRLEWWLMEFGAALAGFCVVPVHATYRRNTEFVSDAFARWSVRCVVCDERDVELYRELTAEVSTLRHVVVVTHRPNAELRDVFLRQRGHTVHAFRSLCGCDGFDEDRAVLDGDAQPVPIAELVQRSTLEEPYEQPKGGPSATVALQLTAGGRAVGKPKRMYPPKAVVVPAERVLAELPTLLDQPLVVPSISPWSYSWERFRVWGVLANGGRMGVMKYISDWQARQESRAQRRVAGEDVADSETEEEEEAEEEETADGPPVDVLSDVESVASSVGPLARRRAVSDTSSSSEEEKGEEDEAGQNETPPDLLDTEQAQDPLAHTSDDFPSWWQDWLADYNTLKPTVLVAPRRVWEGFCAVYTDRKAEIEAGIKKAEDALAALAELEVKKQHRAREAAEAELMEAEDKLSKALRDAARPPPEAQPAAGAGLPRGRSSKLAAMMASVEAMALADAEGRPPTPPPTPPRGKWQREHVKPHYTAATEAKLVVGKHVRRMACVGPAVSVRTSTLLNKALWPARVDVEYATAESGVAMVNGQPAPGVLLDVRVPRHSGLPSSIPYFDPVTSTYETRRHGQLYVKSEVLKEMCPGYLRQPQTTDKWINSSAWLSTGDLVVVSPDGATYTVVGRLPVAEADVLDGVDSRPGASSRPPTSHGSPSKLRK